MGLILSAASCLWLSGGWRIQREWYRDWSTESRQRVEEDPHRLIDISRYVRGWVINKMNQTGQIVALVVIATSIVIGALLAAHRPLCKPKSNPDCCETVGDFLLSWSLYSITWPIAIIYLLCESNGRSTSVAPSSSSSTSLRWFVFIAFYFTLLVETLYHHGFN